MCQFNDATRAMCGRSFSVECHSLSCVARRLEPDCFPSYYTVRMRTEVCPAALVHRNRLYPDLQSVLPSTHRGTPCERRDQVSKKPRTCAER